MGHHPNISVRVRAIIIDEGKLLGVKHPHNTSFCALPGGHLEGDEDIRECLRREIIEELGVEPVIGRLWYINNFKDGDKGQSIEFFFEVTNGADFKNLNGLERTHSHEIAEVCWLAPTDPTPILPKGFERDFKQGDLPSSTSQPRFLLDPKP